MERTRYFDESGSQRETLRALLSLLPLLCAVAGCGSENGLHSVSGHVSYKGKPLEHGSIVLVSPNSRQVTADIEGGEIVNVTTVAANDGIAAGEYMVGITSRDQSEKHKNSMAPPSLIPLHFADISTSGLTATIQPNDDNVLTFELE